MTLRELSDSCERAASTTSGICAEHPARSMAPSLRTRVKDLALAPFRLHRYRDVHSMMLREALCKLDCDKAER